MDSRVVIGFLAILLGACASPPPPPPPAPPPPPPPPTVDQQFEALAARYLREATELTPVDATSLGDHRFDDRLDDVSHAGWQARVTFDEMYLEALAPFVPLCEKLGRLAQGLGNGSVDRVEVEVRGRLAEHDTRLLGIATLVGLLSGHTEEPVNLVNAPTVAEERGIDLIETSDAVSPDFTELITVRIDSGGEAVEVAGTGVGPRNDPYLVRAWGQDFYLPFADHIIVFRYDDKPGMIGLVGSTFGEHGANIVSAAVGAEEGAPEAVMALTADAPVPPEVVAEITSRDDFHAGRAIDFQ